MYVGLSIFIVLFLLSVNCLNIFPSKLQEICSTRKRAHSIHSIELNCTYYFHGLFFLSFFLFPCDILKQCVKQSLGVLPHLWRALFWSLSKNISISIGLSFLFIYWNVSQESSRPYFVTLFAKLLHGSLRCCFILASSPHFCDVWPTYIPGTFLCRVVTVYIYDFL